MCLVLLLLYHAGSAPLDFYFGLVAKINIIIRAKSKQASYAGMVLGSFFFLFGRVIQRLGFWTQKLQANFDYCYVRRRAEYTLLGPGLEHLSLSLIHI